MTERITKKRAQRPTDRPYRITCGTCAHRFSHTNPIAACPRCRNKAAVDLLDSAAQRPDNELLTDDESLALLFWCGYTDEEDMRDYDTD